MAETIQTPLTELLGIKYPIMCAGMGSVSNHELVCAVSNAGGIGTFGGVTMTPDAMRREIDFLKQELKPGMPFGVDLLIPQIGGGARKTNKDYTKGNVEIMCDMIIEEKASLFVCAVGVPPVWMVDRLHAAGIPVMNMVGAPHHVQKALDVGCDIICAQGTEAGGHTGDIGTMALIPQCVDLCRGRRNFLGKPVMVVAAGGVFDGRGLAASLSLGAAGVWVGTRFIATEEAGSRIHKGNVLKARSTDMVRTELFTGRPCRIMRTDYFTEWEQKPEEMKAKLSQGVVPFVEDIYANKASNSMFYPYLMGQAAGAITEVKPAKELVEEMMTQAITTLKENESRLQILDFPPARL